MSVLEIMCSNGKMLGNKGAIILLDQGLYWSLLQQILTKGIKPLKGETPVYNSSIYHHF